MMLMRIGAVVIGAGLGWSLTSPVDPPAPAAPKPAVPPATPIQGAPAPALPCPPSPQSSSALSSQLARAEAMLRFSRGQEELAVGRTLDWPHGVPESHTEDYVGAALDAIDELDDVDVLGLDCVEYPCGFAIAVGGEADVDDVYALYDEFGWEHASTDMDAHRAEGQILYVMRTVLPVTRIEDDLGRKRLSFRKAEMGTLYSEAVAELLE